MLRQVGAKVEQEDLSRIGSRQTMQTDTQSTPLKEAQEFYFENEKDFAKFHQFLQVL